MDGDSSVGDGLDFTGLGGTQGFDSADCCLDTPLLIGSFCFSGDWLCGAAGSAACWEDGASSAEVSSGGVTSSLSASACLLSVLAVRKKNSRACCE